jgi:mannose-6-phosphate isomerase
MRLAGVVKHYPWGDPEAIPRLLGVDGGGEPWAELWYGTHPSGPARLADQRLLSDVAGELPYLVKLLAAARPLSLQVHPTADQAAARFARGRLPDPYAKPELIVALSDFDALSGFRPVAATIELLERIGAVDLAAAVTADGPAGALAALYRGRLAASPIVDTCRTAAGAEAALVVALDEMYPGDPSAAATLLLNRVTLRPGEALFLGAGNLHAYLRGFGVEVMGASDNVIRGGLTPKQVDVDDLLAVVDPTPIGDPLSAATAVEPGVVEYATGDAPFVVRRHDVGAEARWHVAQRREIALCTSGGSAELPSGGAAYLTPADDAELPPGSTVFVTSER